MVDKGLAAYKKDDPLQIKLCKKKTGYQYYKVNKDGQRVYIKKRDWDKVRKAFQRDYYEEVRKALLTQKYRLERFLKLYDLSSISQVFDNLCDARKNMVSPIIDTDENYLEQWFKDHPGNMNTFPEEGTFITDNGEYVRSKSEKILADLFLKLGVPYVYEPRIVLSSGLSAYPDFVLLNLRTRKTYYWEHLGLISDDSYSSKALLKIYAYEKEDIILGENFIISMETPDAPLDVKRIKEKVEKYLM